MWGFNKKPEPLPSAVQLVFSTNPATLNPTLEEHRAFAQWRVDHITRWLNDPSNQGEPLDKIRHLTDERNMYRAMLGMMA